MKSNRPKLIVTLSPILSLLVASTGAAGQIRDQSPSRLIAFLTYQSDDRLGRAMTFSCGENERDREAAKALVVVGEAAVTSIEVALDSIEKHGEPRYAIGADWLLVAFAKIKGPAAYPRLRRMIGDPKLSFLGPALDNAIALSLGLTSYVSGLHESIPVIDCAHSGEPRMALNELILGWERNNLRWIEASLGPGAKASLHSLLKDRTGKDIREQFRNGRHGGGVAVGYRFEMASRWAEPDETLDEERHFGGLTEPENAEIRVAFKDRTGADCGEHLVIFKQNRSPPTRKGGRQEALPYLINNSDLAGILRLIGSCAAR